MVKCNHCGAQIAVGVKICPLCGALVGASTVQENRQSDTTESETPNRAFL